MAGPRCFRGETRTDSGAPRADVTQARALLAVYMSKLERSGKKLAARDAKGLFEKHRAGPFLHLLDMPADIRARDVTEMTRPLINAGKARSAGKLRSYLRAACGMALRAKSDPKAAWLRLHSVCPKPCGSRAEPNRTLSRSELRA